MRIYIGNLPYSTNEEDLRAIFSEYGTVEDVKLITDRYTGRSRGFGFITMTEDAGATQSIENLHGGTLENRTLTVNQAKPREEGGGARGESESGGGAGRW